MSRGWRVFHRLGIGAWVLAAPAAALAQGYSAHHPRLVLTRSEIPALQQKLRDGGPDDDAYQFVRHQVLDEYPSSNLAQLLNVTFGMNFLLNMGLVAQLDPTDAAAARDLGREYTLALCDSLSADTNVFFSPVRLRALCFGYDMCMEDASESERAMVRAEIESYVDSLMFAFNYERWLHPPYASNITAMIGSSLGLAAVCLADEMEPARVRAALTRADYFIAIWMNYHLDPDGSCFEGVQYGTWAMRHLPWYFEARRRYDGKDYSRLTAIRRIENWIAYEVLPEPGGPVNNLNDTSYLNFPLTRHNTYIDWALTRWSSGLAAWTWEQINGPGGHDWGDKSDTPSTVLWYRPVNPVQPGDILPPACLWRERGLYYYRTGWPRNGASDDVVFSFYSGEFHGGHSQEDQNSFTLYAFGERLAADNGFDRPNAQSEAHNLVLIDGQGQHNSGGSTGTDGKIAAHVLSNYADYLRGDATAAYTTHSAYNNPGVPFPDDDWSAGYEGANPVEYALREWIVVHEGETPPYFVLLEDIKKDYLTRRYDWRMHTEAGHTVDLSSNPLRIEGDRGRLLIDVAFPPLAQLQSSLSDFDNVSSDPDTRVLALTQHTNRAAYALIFRPEGITPSVSAEVRTTPRPWGAFTVLEWPNGLTDVVITNLSGGFMVSDDIVPISTDARLAQLRVRDGVVRNFVLHGATRLDTGQLRLVDVHDGPADLVLDGPTLHLDRPASITVFGPNITRVQVDGKTVAVQRDGAFLRSGSAQPADAPATPKLRIFPLPASAGVTIMVEARGPRLTLELFDVAGRRVRVLWDGPVNPGRTPFAWDGRDENFRLLGSGVYFVRARSNSAETTGKVVLVR